ncbi:glycine zipper domain-containing protein [Nannocystis radixulma]|uniref:Glycine zipper domain-containing protein n=1 Tax=Nannocystis radixulma TaxID=2995305 RepID=A0ABT5BET8_9BACT|nr:glycine zipper domain-containing protein [Nannocystis radixulma]MDC0671557.1 glycine zipper domain-containing protein [Nannocystis radixulma]
MTDLRPSLSRRRLFSLTAGGASALLLAQTARAAGPKPVFKPVPDSKLLKALDHVPGDVVQLPEHLRPLAEQLLARAKGAVTSAIAKPASAKGDKIAAAGLKFAARLTPARATRLTASSEQLQVAKVSPFGAFARPGVKLQSVAGFRATVTKVVDVSKLKFDPKVKTPQWKAPLVKKIEFHLNRVRCIEETSEASDSDEILLGGQLVEPNGAVKKFDRFKVSDDFDAGEKVPFDYEMCGHIPRSSLPSVLQSMCPNGSPDDPHHGRKLVSASLDPQVIPFPSTHGLVLVMGEQDSGGFNDLLQDIYAALRDEIAAELDALGVSAGSALGGALGSIVPGLGTAIGAAIGAALGWVLGEFIEWLVGLFNNEDDLIEAKHWTIQLPSPELSAIQGLGQSLPAPAGVWASPLKNLKFRGDGGRYEAHVHWRVFT